MMGVDREDYKFFNARFMDIETQIRDLRDTVIRLDETLKNKPVEVSKQDIIDIKARIAILEARQQEHIEWRSKVMGAIGVVAFVFGGLGAYMGVLFQ